MFSAASVCLFVCLFVNTITSEPVNIGWWNLGVGALYTNLGRVRNRIWGSWPRGCAHPKNVALGYDVGKISAGCLVDDYAFSDGAWFVCMCVCACAQWCTARCATWHIMTNIKYLKETSSSETKISKVADTLDDCSLRQIVSWSTRHSTAADRRFRAAVFTFLFQFKVWFQLILFWF